MFSRLKEAKRIISYREPAYGPDMVIEERGAIMKSRLDPNTTPEQKMEKFNKALGSILRVSKDQMKEALAEDERIRRLRKGKPGPKPSSASDHASHSES